ncbi:MAG: hypothetical protein ABIQ41_11330 [Gemmatimonadales bacterium]
MTCDLCAASALPVLHRWIGKPVYRSHTTACGYSHNWTEHQVFTRCWSHRVNRPLGRKASANWIPIERSVADLLR